MTNFHTMIGFCACLPFLIFLEGAWWHWKCKHLDGEDTWPNRGSKSNHHHHATKS